MPVFLLSAKIESTSSSPDILLRFQTSGYADVFFFCFLEKCCILEYRNCFNSLEGFKKSIVDFYLQNVRTSQVRIPVIDHLARALELPLVLRSLVFSFHLVTPNRSRFIF